MRLRPVDRKIFAIALPAIVTNITTPLLGLMDVAITGHLGKAEYIAAIAVGGNIFNMLYWIFSFLRSGTSGITANAWGAGDNAAVYATLYRSLIIAVSVGALIIAFHAPVIKIFTDWMGISGETAICTTTYFNILVYGAPAFLATYTLSGWLIGMQDSKSAMWLSIFINIVNIATSLVLVAGFKLKIEGVAIGTLSAQWGGAIFGMLLIARRYKPAHIPIRDLMERQAMMRFFKISRDLFLRTLCLVAVTLWFTRVGAGQGTVILAANTLLMQFFMFFSYFTDGFAYAGEALCGRYSGEHNHAMLVETEKRLSFWGLTVALLFVMIYGLGGNTILSLLSDNQTVIVSAREYIWWIILLPLSGFSAFVYDGVFVGLTYTGHLFMSMIVSAAIFFISYLILFPSLGNHGLWIAFLLYLLSRGIFLSLIFRKQFHHH